MNKTAIVLVAAIVVVSGCASNNTGVNSQKNSQGDAVLGEDSTTTYTEAYENMTMRLIVDNDTETYDFTIEQTTRNVTGNELFSRYDTVDLRASVFCGAAQQMTYNYSEISNENDGSLGLEEDSSLSEGLGNDESSEDSELPQWVFDDFKPDTVRYTLTDEATSEQLASCEPTEQQLNIRINVEKDEEAEGSISENSEGLS